MPTILAGAALCVLAFAVSFIANRSWADYNRKGYIPGSTFVVLLVSFLPWLLFARFGTGHFPPAQEVYVMIAGGVCTLAGIIAGLFSVGRPGDGKPGKQK